MRRTHGVRSPLSLKPELCLVSRVTIFPEDDACFGHDKSRAVPKSPVLIVAKSGCLSLLATKDMRKRMPFCRRVAERETGYLTLNNVI